MHLSIPCHCPLPIFAKTFNIDEKETSSSSVQRLQHCNDNDQILDLSLIPEEVIDYIILPLTDTKILHFLKCTNTVWEETY